MSAATSVMSQPKEHGMIVEKDVKIPLRDGAICMQIFFVRTLLQKNFQLLPISRYTTKISCGFRLKI